MDQVSVESLVEKTLAGDKEAFVELVNRFQRLVFGLARQHSAGQADTEDIAQESFLRAYRDLRKLRVPASFGNWLGSIAVRVALEKGRTAGRTIPLGSIPEPQAAGVGGGDVARDEKLLAMVRELPEQYRIPLTLHYVGRRKYAEIARELGENESTVRSLVHRARAMLREMWQAQSAKG
ncbi:MAG: hypothetical protein C0404_08540 [Verrucomicrobia bacterium]|nr:hypothetical protein [Verrucomicrobiota bacterium]